MLRNDWQKGILMHQLISIVVPLDGVVIAVQKYFIQESWHKSISKNDIKFPNLFSSTLDEVERTYYATNQFIIVIKSRNESSVQ